MSVEVASIVSVTVCTALSTMSSSVAVTTTVCGVFQFADVNCREAGLADAYEPSLTVTVTSTWLRGSLGMLTVKLAESPSTAAISWVES